MEDKNDTTVSHLNRGLLDYNTVQSVSSYQHFGRNCYPRQAVNFKMLLPTYQTEYIMYNFQAHIYFEMQVTYFVHIH
jgi:hypothetical protein